MRNLHKTYYNVNKWCIWGEGENKKARLVFSFRDGNPRFVVYTGAKGFEGMINFPADAAHMATVFNLLKEAADGAPGNKESVTSLTNEYVNDKPTANKKVASTLYIGKSKEGLVYLSVIAENKPKIVFTIKNSDYHEFRGDDKNPIPQERISCIMAKAIADIGLNIISRIMIDYTNEEYEHGENKPFVIKDRPGSFGTTDVSSKDILGEISGEAKSDTGVDSSVDDVLNDLG